MIGFIRLGFLCCVPALAAMAEERPKETEPNASLTPAELAEFDQQPEPVRNLISYALSLTQKNLTYAYASADPDAGGMDCSGFIHHVLKQQGYEDVPRQANEQYAWARKAGTFRAVLSRKVDSFELDGLRPGDLLFWSGTYSVKRDPPVTHTMIYLGHEKKDQHPVMVGSTNGRTYRSKPRWGVSVFDFKAGTSNVGAAGSIFVGYARIPGNEPSPAVSPAPSARTKAH